MGCIQKTRADGSLKTRLIVDMRRSGVNGLMKVKQRVVLPRVTDVVHGRHQLRSMYPQSEEALMLINFKDAFYTCQLAEEERKYAVVKGARGYYALKVVAFGLACGPLLWGRVAAALMRLATAIAPEARLQCYTLTVSLLLTCLLWQALGAKLAWEKMQWGAQISWIGFELQLSSDQFVARTSYGNFRKQFRS